MDPFHPVPASRQPPRGLSGSGGLLRTTSSSAAPTEMVASSTASARSQARRMAQGATGGAGRSWASGKDTRASDLGHCRPIPTSGCVRSKPSPNGHTDALKSRVAGNWTGKTLKGGGPLWGEGVRTQGSKLCQGVRSGCCGAQLEDTFLPAGEGIRLPQRERGTQPGAGHCSSWRRGIPKIRLCGGISQHCASCGNPTPPLRVPTLDPPTPPRGLPNNKKKEA